MGDLIVLEVWKKQRAVHELNDLELKLSQYIVHLNLRQQFFMFDKSGKPIEIFLKECSD